MSLVEEYKKLKNLDKKITFKGLRWIEWDESLKDVLGLPGIPMGHITLLRGHSDSGKTTALMHIASVCQKMGILPVIIITEMKWSWDRAKMIGLQFEEYSDESLMGEVQYKGFFIYVDRSSLNSIEDVSEFILDTLEEQKKGKLPFDLCFLWDSIGSLPSRQSIESRKNNNEWNAAAMSQQFGNFVNQAIVLSRKESEPYTNTLVAINRIWVDKPKYYGDVPKIMNKGGNIMFSDSSIVITFGDITSSGVRKIDAIKGGKKVEFAKIVTICCDKNHLTGVTSRGKIVITPHGFIHNTKEAIDAYKKQHSKEWSQILGGEDFVIEESISVEDVTEKYE